MDGSELNLLYISNGYTTHDRHFLQLFRGAGWDVSHLRLLGGQLDHRAVPEGVQSIPWIGDRLALRSPFDYGRRWKSLGKILDKVKPDVVLAGPVPTSAFLVALTDFRPFVAMCWGSDLLVDARKSRGARQAARYALKRAAGAFGDCNAVAEAIRSLAPIPDDRLLTFPWGIDLKRFGPGPSRLDMRAQLGWERNPIFLCTRTWEPVYAIDVLVRAFGAVYQQHSKARLMLLGDGSEAAKIQGLIDELGLRSVVHAPGRVSYELLPDYFRIADVYVSSTLSDGTSISLLEAMACGLPVVVTEAYGNLEWVTPGRNGFLAKPGDADSLVVALNSLLDMSPEQRAEIGRANTATAQARANWDANSPRLIDLLRSASKRTSVKTCPRL